MNTLTISDLNNETASSGNSLHMVMQQLSMSLGISVGAYLLSEFQDEHWMHNGDIMSAFKYTFLSMGFITAFSTLLFFRLKSEDGEQLSGHH